MNLIPNPHVPILQAAQSLLLVVDVQSRFIPVIHQGERLAKQVGILMQAANLLSLPVLVSEQYPKGLGHTLESLQALYSSKTTLMEKSAFGCLGDTEMTQWLAAQGKPQIVVCGIEAHVCVNQTVHQLLAAGYQVFLVQDAVSSRAAESREIALSRMIQSGAVPVSTEMVLFEWMHGATHPHFKAIQALIK